MYTSFLFNKEFFCFDCIISTGERKPAGREERMDNGESFYRRFLEGDESAFDGILALYLIILPFSSTGMSTIWRRLKTLQ